MNSGTLCYFASDLHGRARRYRALFDAVREHPPAAVFLGGDLLPFPRSAHRHDAPPVDDFAREYFLPACARLRDDLKDAYPRWFLVFGNDDEAADTEGFRDPAAAALCTCLPAGVASFGPYRVLGYSYVPPTPFQLKDWERYDVGATVPPGCVSPEEGRRTAPAENREIRYGTIAADLARLGDAEPMDRLVLLAHSPPYRTCLDRAALDGKTVDHVPLDVHVGSVAIRRFLEDRQPRVGLHGHIHESARLTGSWRDRIGRTPLFGAAHDGPELALVRFDLEDPESARRDLL